MIAYLLKSLLCSSVFIAVYYFLLEKERIHVFKRFYLLISLGLSLIVPAVSIEHIGGTQFVQQVLLENSGIAASIPGVNKISTETSTIVIPVFIVIYSLVTLILLIKFFKNVRAVYLATDQGLHTAVGQSKLIILPYPLIPHTFLNYIFIGEQDSENKQILKHELTHSRQRHSLDILFIELVHCIFWINPILMVYKKAIKLNHEFLADESVIEEYRDVQRYQNLLLHKITALKTPTIVSAFNYSMTKKRLTMMTTSRNNQRSIFRIAAAVIILLVTSAFSVNVLYAQAPSMYEYTIYKDGKWQNVKTTNTPRPVDNAAFLRELARAVRYPASAKAAGIEGYVAIMFEVDANGRLGNFSVAKELQRDCETEVINAILNAGVGWRPAELNGKNYPSRFVLPMRFQFDGSKITGWTPLSMQAKVMNEVVVTTYAPAEN